MGKNLFEDLLHEKSYDLHKFVKDRPAADDTEQSLNQLSEDVVVYGSKFEKTKLGAEDLEYLSQEIIKAKIDEFMETILDPEADAKAGNRGATENADEEEAEN